MAQATGKLASINFYSSTTTVPSAYQVGQRVMANNGKEFMYVKAGAVTLVVGNLLQSAAEDTQFENMAVLAAAIATTLPQTVTVTLGTTTVNANDFDGGSIVVYTTPDAGSEYTIVAHTTGTSGQNITVTLDHPLATAWTTSTKINMKRHIASGVIVAPTTQTGVPVGIATYAIPAASYGWIQTKGMASVLSDSSTYAVGSELGTPCANTAGAPAVYAAGTTHAKVGYVLQAQASTHWVSIMLNL
jgi:hypothetical protein